MQWPSASSSSKMVQGTTGCASGNMYDKLIGDSLFISGHLTGDAPDGVSNTGALYRARAMMILLLH